MSHNIFCQKLQKEAESLDGPPYPGVLGQEIYAHISKEAWQLWVDKQTILINEYRLNLLDGQAREFLRKEMKKFLFNE